MLARINFESNSFAFPWNSYRLRLSKDVRDLLLVQIRVCVQVRACICAMKETFQYALCRDFCEIGFVTWTYGVRLFQSVAYPVPYRNFHISEFFELGEILLTLGFLRIYRRSKFYGIIYFLIRKEIFCILRESLK